MTRPAARDSRPGPGILLLALGLAAALAFAALEITGKGFPGLRQYELEFLHRLPAGEAAFYIKYLALLLPAGLLAGLGLSFLLGRRPFENGLGRLERIPDRTFQISVAAIGAGLVLLVALFVLRDQPVTDDERVYVFQADLLSRGQLYRDSEPLPEFYDNIFIVNNGKWYGKYPPGHPLVLVPGVALGFPRLIPLLLAAINLLLFYAVARQLLSLRAARSAVVLLLVSPFFLFTGATLLSHTTSLAALLLMALGVLRSRSGGGAGWWIAAGVGAGFAFLTRPYTALLVGGPVAVAWLIDTLRRKAPLKPWLGAAAIALLFLLAFLGYNQALTGNPFRTGYDEIQGTGGKVLGFGEIFRGQYTHTPLDGLLNVGLTIVRLNFWSWGWPLGWLFVIAALLWARDRRWTPLWAILGVTAVGAIFYFSMGVADTGPAKYYEILPVLTLLTIAGLQAFESRVAGARRPGLSALAPSLLLAFTAIGWVFFARIEAADLRRVTATIAEPYRIVKELEDPKVLIFTAQSLQKEPFTSWVFSAPNNVPDPDKPIVYVRDKGIRNRQLMARMPERIPYLLEIGKGNRYAVTRLSGDEATKRYAEEKVRQGILFLRQKNSREAIKSFLEATQIDPGYPRGYLLMGWALEQAGLPDAAEPAYRKALELDPEQGDHYFFLGRFLARQKKFDEAVEKLEKALEMNPRSKEVQTALQQARDKIPPP